MQIKFLLLSLLFFGFGPAEISAQGESGAPATPKTVSAGVLNGKATNLVKPAYPAAASAVRASGAVNVQVTIDEEGSVISASAVSGHPLLRASAVQAARQSKFAPTRLSGQAVKVTGVIVYNFVLPAETNASQEDESEQLISMGMVMFLTALKDIPGDAESDEILLDLGKELPASMKIEKAQFERLVRAQTQSEKAVIIDEIIAQMRKGLTGTDVWWLDLGKHWGGAIGEAFRITDSEYRRDRQNFIKNLQGMGWLLEAPPKDVSAESLSKIRAIAAYDTETDSVTPQFINNFFKTSLNFIEYIVGDSKKDN
jgi:TonB family protein